MLFVPTTNAKSLGVTTALTGTITREKAINHSLNYSPSLNAMRSEMKALQSEAHQAGLSPNPEFEFEIENFAGSNERRGFDGAEITGAISQKIELGDKRYKRTLVATLKSKALEARVKSREREVEDEVNKAFISLLEVKQLSAVHAKNVKRAEDQLQIVSVLVEEGSSTRIAENKARIALSEAKASLSAARQNEVETFAQLSQIWGGSASSLSVKGSLSSQFTKSSISTNQAISNHPELQAARFDFAHSQAIYELEKAKRISDVTVGLGVKEDREANDTMGVLRLRVPLPITNNNQGNIDAARERVENAKSKGNAKASELSSRLVRLNARVQSARDRLDELDSNTLIAAQQTLSDTRDAYASGKLSFLELLDARQDLFEIEVRQIKAQADFQRAMRSLQTLTRK